MIAGNLLSLYRAMYSCTKRLACSVMYIIAYSFLYKVGIIGDKDSVMGFLALGIDIFPAYEADEIKKTIRDLAFYCSYTRGFSSFSLCCFAMCSIFLFTE